MANAISITDLRKKYEAGPEALKGVTLSVEEGDFFALLGPNGAGKTTLIGILTSLVNKTSGEAKIFDASIDTEASNFPRALLGWFSGCIMIWSALFTVGNFLYGRTNYALALLVIFVVSGTVLLRIVQRLWR